MPAGRISLYSKELRLELTESRAVGVFELLPRWRPERLGDPQSTEQCCCVWPEDKDDLWTLVGVNGMRTFDSEPKLGDDCYSGHHISQTLLASH